VACALAVLCWPGRVCAQTEQADLGGVARDLAGKLGPELIRRGPKDRSEKFRVAVFPFSDSKGRYTLQMGDNGPVLRGALCDELRTFLDKKAPGKFTVLYPEQIDEKITESASDPEGISGKNLALARRLLKSFDFQVGIVGRFDGIDFAALRPAFGTVKILVKGILAGDEISAASAVFSDRIGDLGFVPKQPVGKRLGVRFFVKMDPRKRDSDPDAWKPMPLSVSSAEQTRNLLYLVVPKAYRGKRYKVVLVNHGKPAVHNPLVNDGKSAVDPDRLFSAALLIDGANSFMRPEGKQYRHVSGFPAVLPKWIITPVGKRLVQDREGIKDRVRGARLEAVRGPGGSEVHVRGFQKGRDVAGAFVFAQPAQSVAAPELLSLRKIGTISIYFYSERLPGDPLLYASKVGPAGTAMGEEVRSATFPVKVLHWNDEPWETWHITYRYEGDPSLPRDLKPLP
jgi:hypothetical protein